MFGFTVLFFVLLFAIVLSLFAEKEGRWFVLWFLVLFASMVLGFGLINGFTFQLNDSRFHFKITFDYMPAFNYDPINQMCRL